MQRDDCQLQDFRLRCAGSESQPMACAARKYGTEAAEWPYGRFVSHIEGQKLWSDA